MGELRALVVEDSVVHQRLLAEAFRAVGQPVRLEVHANAESAWDAIEAMRYQTPAEWPDFAIVDVGLPGISGIELVDRIRQLRPFDEWPIVVLTASQDPEDRTESYLAKATGYFLKPTVASGYASLVRGILRFLGLPPEAGSAAGHPSPYPRPGNGKPDSPSPRRSS